MHGEIALDNKGVFSMFQFTNIVNEKHIDDPYGQVTVGRLLQSKSKYKAFLEAFGIYRMRNASGPSTPVMTFLGLKGLLSRLPGKVAEKYKRYCIDITTRVEAGDSSMFHVIKTNAASSNICNAMVRDALAQERVSGGIAAPPEQVLAVRACVRLCLCDFI